MDQHAEMGFKTTLWWNNKIILKWIQQCLTKTQSNQHKQQKQQQQNKNNAKQNKKGGI